MPQERPKKWQKDKQPTFGPLGDLHSALNPPREGAYQPDPSVNKAQAFFSLSSWPSGSPTWLWGDLRSRGQGSKSGREGPLTICSCSLLVACGRCMEPFSWESLPIGPLAAGPQPVRRGRWPGLASQAGPLPHVLARVPGPPRAAAPRRRARWGALPRPARVRGACVPLPPAAWAARGPVPRSPGPPPAPPPGPTAPCWRARPRPPAGRLGCGSRPGPRRRPGLADLLPRAPSARGLGLGPRGWRSGRSGSDGRTGLGPRLPGAPGAQLGRRPAALGAASHLRALEDRAPRPRSLGGEAPGGRAVGLRPWKAVLR